MKEQLNEEEECKIDWFDYQDDGNKLSEFVVTEKMVEQAINETKQKHTKDPYGLTTFMIAKIKQEIIPQITSITKQSFDLGHVSEKLKDIHISPIPKPNKDKQDPSKIRPINLTSIVLKIMERVSKVQIDEHLEENGILSKAQDGFRTNRSCITTLTKIGQEMRKNLAQKKGGVLLLCDFSKAFDKVLLLEMMKELYKCGIVGKAAQWLQSSLYDNHFRVRIGEAISDKQKLTSSIKQGSVLAPKLFIIFINSLAKELEKEEIEFYFFADDLSILCQIDSDNKAHKIHRALEISEQWSIKNKLLFNKEKCVIIKIGTYAKIEENFMLYNYQLQTEKEGRLLGLTITGETNDPYVSARKKARGWFLTAYHKLKKIFKKARYKIIKIVYNAYYLSKALYGSEIYSNYEPDFTVYKDKKPQFLRTGDHLYRQLFSQKRPNLKEKEKLKSGLAFFYRPKL